MMHVDDSVILAVLRSAERPVPRTTIAKIIGYPMPKYDRILDRQLQRLRRAGAIRYYCTGWQICKREAKRAGAAT